MQLAGNLVLIYLLKYLYSWPIVLQKWLNQGIIGTAYIVFPLYWIVCDKFCQHSSRENGLDSLQKQNSLVKTVWSHRVQNWCYIPFHRQFSYIQLGTFLKSMHFWTHSCLMLSVIMGFIRWNNSLPFWRMGCLQGMFDKEWETPEMTSKWLLTT